VTDFHACALWFPRVFFFFLIEFIALRLNSFYKLILKAM